jgi:succinate dehydrogenase/fumarate reductase flavoprotein subunit
VVVWVTAALLLKPCAGPTRSAATSRFCWSTRPPWIAGAVAQGLSAINTYLGKNDVDDYVRMVRTDLMGIVREDLIYDLGRHVDDSVHLFEEWGLPCWVKKDGKNLDGAQAKAEGLSLRTGAARPLRPLADHDQR